MTEVKVSVGALRQLESTESCSVKNGLSALPNFRSQARIADWLQKFKVYCVLQNESFIDKNKIFFYM